MTHDSSEVKHGGCEPLLWTQPKNPASLDDSSVWLLCPPSALNHKIEDAQNQFEIKLKYGLKKPKLSYKSKNPQSPFVATANSPDGHYNSTHSVWRLQYRNSD